MIKVVVIDDEKYCVDLIIQLLEELSPKYDVIASFTNPIEALNYLNDAENSIDLLFLDIMMPRLTGFELLQQLPKISFDVIFTTAYNHYAIEAFKYSAINYLLKPINHTDIVETLAIWEERKMKTYPEQWEILKGVVENQKIKQLKKIALPINGDYNIFDIEAIIRCQSEDNYTHIYFKDQKSVFISRTLKSIEELLEPFDFIRVHQSHLVNVNYISNMVMEDRTAYLCLKNDEQIPVSRQKRKIIKEYLIQLG